MTLGEFRTLTDKIEDDANIYVQDVHLGVSDQPIWVEAVAEVNTDLSVIEDPVTIFMHVAMVSQHQPA